MLNRISRRTGSRLVIVPTGDVVGYSTHPERAVLWSGGEIIDLGTLGGNSAAYAINDAGQVVGMSYVAQYESHAFLWQDGTLIDLTATFDAPIGAGRDINALGQIIGGSILLDLNGTITDLGSLGGGVTVAEAINDHGQVVGYSYRANDEYAHGFVWTDGVMTDLSAIGGFYTSRTYGINNAGQIIGVGGEPRPWCGSFFLYEPDTGMRRLRDLIPVDSGTVYLRPYDINDAGQIAGTAMPYQGDVSGSSRAFLMSPIPESEETPIPAASHWGVTVLGLLILCAGTVLLRSRVRFISVGNRAQPLGSNFFSSPK